MKFNVNFINDQNKCQLRKTDEANAIYISDLKEEWYTPDALRAFSLKTVIEGSIHFQSGNREFDLDSGNYLLAAYQPGLKAHNPVPVKALCIDIKPDTIAEVYEIACAGKDYEFDNYQSGHFKYPNFLNSIHSLTTTRLGGTLKYLLDCLTNQPENTQLIDDEILPELIEQIILIGENDQAALNKLKSLKVSTRIEILGRLKKGKAFVDDSYLNNPSIPEVARESNMSEFHFFRCFKQVYGMSPYNYILSKRLSHSKKLLNAKIPIHKIAHICGFSDSSTYTKAFTREYGKSPSKYTSDSNNNYAMESSELLQLH